MSLSKQQNKRKMRRRNEWFICDDKNDKNEENFPLLIISLTWLKRFEIEFKSDYASYLEIYVCGGNINWKIIPKLRQRYYCHRRFLFKLGNASLQLQLPARYSILLTRISRRHKGDKFSFFAYNNLNRIYLGWKVSYLFCGKIRVNLMETS